MRTTLLAVVFTFGSFASADGKFEIKDAPVGKWRLVYWHERGYHKGKDGPLGFPHRDQSGQAGWHHHGTETAAFRDTGAEVIPLPVAKRYAIRE